MSPRRTKGAILILAVALLGVVLIGPLGPGAGDAAARENVTDDRPVNRATQAIESVAYSGTGAVREIDGTGYVFRDENTTATVRFDSGYAPGDHFACLEARPNASDGDAESDPVEIACSETHNTTATDSRAAFEIDIRGWTAVQPGELVVDIVVYRQDPATIGTTDVEVVRANRTVHVLEKDGDVSNNGLTNREELRRGTNFAISDTTRSGLNDYEELHTYGTDPLDVDTDNDGIPDSTEVMINTDPTDPGTTPLLLGVGVIPVTVLMGLFGFVVTQFDSMLPDLYGDDPGSSPSGGEYGSGRPPGGGENGSGRPPGGGASSSTEAPTDESSDPTRPEPLTDEDRIVEIIAENDGRVRQQEIVQRTDWSKSKVSRRLSKMEDEGLISKISVGRENLVTFHDEEPDAAKAPFESN